MAGRFFRRAALAVGALVGLVLLLALLYAGRVAFAARTAVASAEGTRAGMPVDGPVTIARDARGVPHIRAGSVHDLFVAEGYAVGSDRLFQIDLTRRFVDGRLAELIGSPVLRVDRRMRRYGIRDLAARVFAKASPDEQALLTAFADGINAAATREPAPPEYAALFAGFEPWRPEDSLAVGFATVLDLDDRPDDVVIRDMVRREVGDKAVEAFYPLTDPKYDVPTNGRPPGPIPKLPDLPPPRLATLSRPHAIASRPDVILSRPNVILSRPNVILSLSKDAPKPPSRASAAGLTLRQAQGDVGGAAPEADVPDAPGAHAPDADPAGDIERAPVGSNAWAVGANRSTVGRAMLANDPHLDIGIPGIWYLAEASAPGLHIAGAALAGTPGVTLGHNEHLAWGVTAGETAAMRVMREPARGGDEFFEDGRWVRARHRSEPIRVRFGATIDADILETGRGVVIARGENGGEAYVMDWRFRRRPVSPLAPFLALLRARSAAEGVAAMRALPEPALNVILADDGGRAAYHFAGAVPMEQSWGRWASDANAPEPAYLGYDRAPHVDPSRDALIVTGNNRADGDGSPRLAPFWPPPYRAFEIRRALGAAADANGRLSPDAVAAEQRDNGSPAEREFADLVLAAASHQNAQQSDASLGPLLTALRSFDGMMVSESRGATAAVALRRDMLAALAERHLSKRLAAVYPPTGPGFEIVLRALRERPRGWVARDDYDAFVIQSMKRVAARYRGEIPTFGEYAAQPLAHPLAPFGLKAWNGPTMPGRGGSFAPAVQWNGHAQSFRAMWIAGDWDNGTIDIDAGESGEPGSPHYADQTPGWIRFARTPLPFSDAAVQAATRTTLTLTR
ncbi:MAG TPA: penicillin acylase family protein [Candidatus Elarobacter sp.]